MRSSGAPSMLGTRRESRRVSWRRWHFRRILEDEDCVKERNPRLHNVPSEQRHECRRAQGSLVQVKVWESGMAGSKAVWRFEEKPDDVAFWNHAEEPGFYFLGYCFSASLLPPHHL